MITRSPVDCCLRLDTAPGTSPCKRVEFGESSLLAELVETRYFGTALRASLYGPPRGVPRSQHVLVVAPAKQQPTVRPTDPLAERLAHYLIVVRDRPSTVDEATTGVFIRFTRGLYDDFESDVIDDHQSHGNRLLLIPRERDGLARLRNSILPEGDPEVGLDERRHVHRPEHRAATPEADNLSVRNLEVPLRTEVPIRTEPQSVTSGFDW